MKLHKILGCPLAEIGRFRQTKIVSDSFQFLTQGVFQVPLLRSVESEFEADEELVLVRSEVVHGFRLKCEVEANEAFFVGVFGEEDFVLRELGAARERVVEHEAVLEQHLVQHLVLLELKMERGFLFW